MFERAHMRIFTHLIQGPLHLANMAGQSPDSPVFVKGEVVKGFGRGSKDLGCPTANFPEDLVNGLREDLDIGVYCGFGQVEDGEVYKMVLSLGWNPVYKNTKKSMETHIMHEYDADFYGKELKIVILKYLRPELNFNSLDDLIKQIKADIQDAKVLLDRPEYAVFQSNAFFS